jgi:hypothetical protein
MAPPNEFPETVDPEAVGSAKLTGDLGNVIEATSIGGRRSDFFTARKLALGNLGLLQQYLPSADSCTAARSVAGAMAMAQGTNQDWTRLVSAQPGEAT